MVKHLSKLKTTIDSIKTMCEEIYEELGPGFNEEDYQKAMSLEFAKSKEFTAIREISVELFYKDQYLKFGELDFLIEPKKGTSNYPLPFFIETKVMNAEKVDYYDQMRRYLMNLPKNSSPLINKIEIAVLVMFRQNSDLISEVLEKEGNKILTRAPSKPIKPGIEKQFWTDFGQEGKVFIKCFTYDQVNKQLQLIEDI